MTKPLSKKHRRFVNEYLKCFNQTEAYLKVYPTSTYDAARAHAARLVTNGNVREEIEKTLAEVHMSAEEALKLQAEIARGDMGQIMEVSSNGFYLDMQKAQQAGLTKLIKKVKQRTTIFIAKKPSDEDREITELEIELYPADVAQERILKMHGKFLERVDVTSGGEPLKVIIEYANTDTE